MEPAGLAAAAPLQHEQKDPLSSLSRPSSPSDESHEASLEHAAFDDEFQVWLDKVNSSSVYDLLGTSWASETRRLLNTALHAIKRLDADLPRSSSEIHRKRSVRIREKFVLKIHKQFDALESRLQNPVVTKKVDKIAFFLGVSNLWVSAILVGFKPYWIPFWFTLQCIFLVVVRWIIYKKKNFHYFLADMCYLVNAVLILFIHFYPYSRPLFIVLYTCSHGPVAWAIVTWRNSMVFHSLDKMTSVFIHLYPSVTLAVMRWRDPHSLTAASPFYDVSDVTNPLEVPDFFSMSEGLFLATVAYAVWQIAYYVLILRRRRTEVYIDGYATSFTWLMHSGGKIARFVSIFGEKYQLAAFMMLQFVYSLVTVVPSVFFARSMVANGVFIALMLSVSIWNASTFYIDVFSSRYAMDLAKLEKEFKNKFESIGGAIRTSPKQLPSAPNSELRHRSISSSANLDGDDVVLSEPSSPIIDESSS